MLVTLWSLFGFDCANVYGCFVGQVFASPFAYVPGHSGPPGFLRASFAIQIARFFIKNPGIIIAGGLAIP